MITGEPIKQSFIILNENNNAWRVPKGSVSRDVMSQAFRRVRNKVDDGTTNQNISLTLTLFVDYQLDLYELEKNKNAKT